MNIIDVAMDEIETGNKVWEYHDKMIDDNTEEIKEEEDDSTYVVDAVNTGVRVEYFYVAETNSYSYKVYSRSQDKEKFQLCREIQFFLQQIMNVLGDAVEKLSLFTEHKRFDQIFRGSPRYLGKPWRDWAMVNWGNNNNLPGQIWIFVDLQDIPDNLAYPPGIYAVIESANPNDNEEEIGMSELFVPYTKEMRQLNDPVNNPLNFKRKFYLVDVESFAAPAIVIPDIGNDNPAALLQLLPKEEWADQFVTWLSQEHTREFD